MKNFFNYFLSFFVLFILPEHATAQEWTLQQTLHASTRHSFDHYGKAVDVTKYTAAIGAPNVYRASTFYKKCGVVFLLEQGIDNGWYELQMITASDFDRDDLFGASLAIERNLLVVGAPYEDHDLNDSNFIYSAGSAYVFEQGGDFMWTETQKLVASDRRYEDQFGNAVAVSGNYIAIGAPYHGLDSQGKDSLASAGAVYLFKKDISNNWTEVAKLTASDRKLGLGFGKSISMHNDRLIIGSWEGAYVYEFDEIKQEWKETARLIDGLQLIVKQSFGLDVAIHGDFALVGAPQIPVQNTSRVGKAFLFRKDVQNGWELFRTILPDEIKNGIEFGFTVEVNDRTIAIGSGEGEAVYIYANTENVIDWELRQKITDPAMHMNFSFGRTLAMDDSTIIIGDYSDDYVPLHCGSFIRHSAGAAYIFQGASYVGGEEVASDQTIEVYPNPVTTQINIKLGSNQAGVYFELYTVLGSRVIQLRLDESVNSVNVDYLRSGCYFYKIVENDQLIKQGKLIIE